MKEKECDDMTLELLLEQIPAHIYWKDNHGVILGCSKETWKNIGLASINDCIGKTDYDFFPESQADLLSKIDREVIKTKKTIVIEERGSLFNGTESIFLSHKTPLKNKKNEVIGVLGVSLNVTDAKIKEKNQLRILNDIVKLIPGHVYWKDINGHYLGCNEEQAKSLGLKSREDIVNKVPYENLPDSEMSLLREGDNRVLIHGETITIEEKGIRENGEVGVFLTKKTPLFNENNVIIGLLGVSFDITDRKNQERELLFAKDQAERANQLKSEFIENMQHDIRTPISGIFSLLDATYKSHDMEEFKKYLPHVLNASRELLDIHNAVIDFDDIEYGEKPVYDRKFSLLELLHSTIYLNSAAALAHESTLALEVDNEVPDVIKGDDYRLKKILINLIGNAIKFTEKGKVTVYVGLVNQQDKQVTIRFSVEDTGIGIPEEKLPTIFEKFIRLNPSNRGKFKGSGLGLHIVKKFVSEMSGELDVKSVVNEGSIFTVDVVFTLPLAQQLAGEKAHQELSRTMLIGVDKVDTPTIASTTTTPPIEPLSTQHADTSGSRLGAIHICLIEDSAIAMMAAENILSKLSHPCHIEKAVNVAEANAMLEKQPFNLVICDLGLPDGTGFDIIGKVKSDKKHINYETAFVALTAHSDDARKEMAKKSGFLGFYNKPFSKDAAEKILIDHVPSENNEPVVFDLALTAKMFNNNEQSALEMLNMLISSFAEERVLFKDAFAHNDYTRARELFHKFRGGISYMRVPQVDIQAMILHDDVKTYERENKPLMLLNDKLQALFKSVDDVQNWLERYHKATH